MLLEKATRVPGTSRREQLREIAVREARLREVVRDLFRSWDRVVTPAALERAFRQKNFPLDELGRDLERELRRKEDQIEIALFGRLIRAEPTDFTAGLDPLVVRDLTRRQIGDLVVGLTTQAKTNLRRQLVQLFQSGEVTRAHLDAIGAVTGLTGRHTIAVGAFRDRLLASGLPELEASRRAKAYAGRLLNLRARTIARTEAVRYTASIVEARAAAEGMVKQWVSARDADVDTTCNDLDNGEKVPARSRFSSGASRPPAHPGCRCVLEIFREKPTRPKRRRRQTKTPVVRPRKPKPKPDLVLRPAKLPTGDARTAAQVGAELEKAGTRGMRLLARANDLNAETKFAREKIYAEIIPLRQKLVRKLGLKAAGDTSAILLEPEWIAKRKALESLNRRLKTNRQRIDRMRLAVARRLLPIVERAPGDRAVWKSKVPKKWREGEEIFKRLVHRDVVSMQDRNARLAVGVTVVQRGERAWYVNLARLPKNQGFGPLVRISKGDPRSVLVHEFGHALEDINPNVLAASRRFLDRRAGGDPIERLNDLFPGRYELNELTRKDAFISAYTGKLYSDATEVVSQGLQYMAENPLVFWQRDPDHFRYIWDVMRNRIP